jgi:hypothetical protein
MKILVLGTALFVASVPEARTVTIVPQQAPALTAPLERRLAPPTDTSPKFDIRPDFQGYMKVIPAPNMTKQRPIVPRALARQILPDEAPATGPFRFMPLERDQSSAGSRR